ncbi:MAG: sigma-70 family RNA polymerase sigma factor [Planctomycetota bacterium]|nr:sigma-70 family RNA polymerase sigma factor [Planctomycetota bacterium]
MSFATLEAPGRVPCPETAVDRLHARVERMARHYAGRSGEDADDLIQEAWLGLLEGLRATDPRIGDPYQYLLRRAKWRVLDALKRARVRRATALGEDLEPVLDDCGRARTPTDDPADGVSSQEFSRELSGTQRAILGCLMDGLTWREAGARLGCSSANVCYHVREIRRRYERWSNSAAAV